MPDAPTSKYLTIKEALHQIGDHFGISPRSLRRMGVMERLDIFYVGRGEGKLRCRRVTTESVEEVIEDMEAEMIEVRAERVRS